MQPACMAMQLRSRHGTHCLAHSGPPGRPPLTLPVYALHINILQVSTVVPRAAIEWYGPDRPKFLGASRGSVVPCLCACIRC
jgi:hypothetical protein